MSVTVTTIKSELAFLALTIAVLLLGLPRTQSREEALSQLGLCTFKCNCLSGILRKFSLFSGKNIGTVGCGILLWNQEYLWLART